MIYKNNHRNHVILPGREKALEVFLNAEFNGEKHKLKHSYSSNSEDALTWSCFEMLANLPNLKKIAALDELLEDAYQDVCNFKFKDKSYLEGQIEIFIGKSYTGISTGEETEVDASIELPDKIIFFEAKLYSSVSLADGSRPDQIARKLRVGLDCCGEKEFYFIFLDLAPNNKLLIKKSKEEASKKENGGFYDKWKSAWWFDHYKNGGDDHLNLKECLTGIKFEQSIASVSKNMGWITWSDLFKIIMRSTV